jgi:hypothetical protein
VLITTTFYLPGRRYRPLGVVTAGCTPLNTGSVVYLYLQALNLLAQEARRRGGNALIGVRITMDGQLYMRASGTAIWLEDAQDQGPLRDMWDFFLESTKGL